jgi:PAS domain-containing protein
MVLEQPTDAMNVPQRLRIAAETSLREGTAPTTLGWPIGAEVLECLYRLASSSSELAADAHHVLRELRVYQVELDLLYSQLIAQRRQLSDVLSRYRTLCELAPVCCYFVDRAVHILECNRMGAALLRLSPDEARGHPLEELLPPHPKPILDRLLRKLGKNRGANGAVHARLRFDEPAMHGLRVSARTVPGLDAYLVIVYGSDTQVMDALELVASPQPTHTSMT